ncbi:MAG: hypothetical protein AMXMBFR64_39510 [Myxococcales bacterium]
MVTTVGDTVFDKVPMVAEMVIGTMVIVRITVGMVIVLVRDRGHNQMVPATAVNPGCGPVSGGPRRRWVVDPILTLRSKRVPRILGEARRTRTLMELTNLIVADAASVQQQLFDDTRFAGLIEGTTTIPRPFVGGGPVRVVIIGQDPTVQRASSRASVRTVLNLDRKGSLRTFIERVCSDLGIDLDANVYATNLAKGFFSDPPTTILKRTGRDVLVETAPAWLPLLRRELDAFPEAVVISLGEPVLKALIKPEHPQEMKHYWGWRDGWKRRGPKPCVMLDSDHSTIGRRFFPFVHQPTMTGTRTEFYRWRWPDYTAFIRASSGL